jgi:hypothetical protein
MGISLMVKTKPSSLMLRVVLKHKAHAIAAEGDHPGPGIFQKRLVPRQMPSLVLWMSMLAVSSLSLSVFVFV